MARRNIWEQIWESTEGPTVTVTLPRDHAESLLKVLAASLEQDMGDEDGMGDDEGDLDDHDSLSDLDFGGHEEPDMDDMGGMPDGDMDDMPAGDMDDDDMDMGPPKKKGPGRPPGSKNKKKSDKPEKKDDGDKDKDDEEPKEESAGDYRPQTALGESSFSRLSRAMSRSRGKR